MSDRLKKLIDKAREHRMSPEEIRAQQIRFAYCNAHYENDRITPELAVEVLRELGTPKAVIEMAF